MKLNIISNENIKSLSNSLKKNHIKTKMLSKARDEMGDEHGHGHGHGHLEILSTLVQL